MAGRPTESIDLMTDTASNPRTVRTRSAVLDAGVAILFDAGPDGVTHAAVANAASVSRTTIYKHWPTRAELLFDILNQVEPHKNVEPSGDVRTDLLAMTFNIADAFADARLTKVFGSLLAQAQWDDDTNQAREALIAAGMADTTRIFQTAVENGQLPATIDAERAAGQLIGPMFFAAFIVRRPVTHPEVEQLVDDWLTTHHL